MLSGKPVRSLLSGMHSLRHKLVRCKEQSGSWHERQCFLLHCCVQGQVEGCSGRAPTDAG